MSLCGNWLNTMQSISHLNMLIFTSVPDNNILGMWILKLCVEDKVLVTPIIRKGRKYCVNGNKSCLLNSVLGVFNWDG